MAFGSYVLYQSRVCVVIADGIVQDVESDDVFFVMEGEVVPF